MVKIFTEDYFSKVPNRSLEKLAKDYLRADHILSRSMTIIQIGLKWDNEYAKYSKLLLSELNEEIHFEHPRLGISSAWTNAIVLAENLKSKDYLKLKNAFAKWPKEEKELLFNWMKDHNEQRNILEFGKIDP